MHLPFRRAALVAALASACAASTLPVVDLGYELHRAISLDVRPVPVIIPRVCAN